MRRLLADQQQPDAQRLGAAAATFVQARLRMQDVREYLVDALGTYASLQRFTPRQGLTLHPRCIFATAYDFSGTYVDLIPCGMRLLVLSYFRSVSLMLARSFPSLTGRAADLHATLYDWSISTAKCLDQMVQ